MSVKIGSLDVRREIDPYHQDTQGRTITTLNILPASRRCYISQEYDDNATPADVWHRIDLACSLSGYLDAGQLREYLAGDEGQALLDRICDGHTTDWNGSNMVGRMDDDAEAALDELLGEIESYHNDDLAEWTCDEWMGQCSDAELAISETTTDEEINTLAARYEDEAGVYLIDDVADYLRERRDALK